MSTETKTPTTSGEVIERPFMTLAWQRGLASEVGVNGLRVEDVLQVAAEKLQSYQQGPLACEENKQALNAIVAAVRALEGRRRRRQEQGVLNTMSAHETERTEDVEDDFSATGA